MYSHICDFYSLTRSERLGEETDSLRQSSPWYVQYMSLFIEVYFIHRSTACNNLIFLRLPFISLFAVSPQCLISTRSSMAYRKLRDKHKKERSKGQEGNECRRWFRGSQTCRHFAKTYYATAHYSSKCIILRHFRLLLFHNHSICFIITALEQPRRALDLHTPAKHLALAYVYATSLVTSKTSLRGRERGSMANKVI